MLKHLDLPRGVRPEHTETPRDWSNDTTNNWSNDTTNRDAGPAPRLADIGITKHQSSAWQRLADLPDEEYEAYKSEARTKGKEITEAGAVRIAKHREREQVKKEKAVKLAEVVEQKPKIALASWEDWLPTQPSCDLLITDPPYSTDVNDVFEFAASWLPAALDKVKPSGRAYVCIGAYPDELLAYLMVKPPEHRQAKHLRLPLFARMGRTSPSLHHPGK